MFRFSKHNYNFNKKINVYLRNGAIFMKFALECCADIAKIIDIAENYK